MKKLTMILCFGILLTGCSAESGNTEKGAAMQAEAAAAEAKKTVSGTEAGYDGIFTFLEQFEEDLVFSDMDPELAESYGAPLKDSYEFAGRVTPEGTGYVLGFKKEESSLFDGLSVYGKDDCIEAAVWDEKQGEYKSVYTFDTITSLYQGSLDLKTPNQVLYLQPMDMTEPEEIENAFRFRYCMGLKGKEYAEDVLSRGVRFSPPDTGAYLSVERYENGIRRTEFVPLTGEEERKILDSDEVIPPEMYGNTGLEFYVSQETYEKTDMEKGAITTPALEIAEKRCRFQAGDLSEIRDIVKADLKVYDKDGGRENAAVKLHELTKEEITELAAILGSAEAAEEGKCPYTGVLTLTREDGREIIVSLAMDGCSGFTLGSYSFYSLGNEKTERIREMFPEAEGYVGWAESASEEAAVQGDTAGPGSMGE